ncbi:MAG: asparagine synthase-related protein [Gammaproteobacteria bacterium]
MLYLDWKFTLADNDLRKVNRMCEACGVEVRYPMLDADLVTLSTRIPARIMLKGFGCGSFKTTLTGGQAAFCRGRHS